MYKFYGVLKSDILTFIPGLTAKKLHSQLKYLFRIESLTSLSEHQMWGFLMEIQAYFASEYGIELPLSEEGKTMKEKLETINYEYD